MIRYEQVREREIRVLLDDKVVGNIVWATGGFAYRPKGSKLKGETFKTVAEVKASLEGEAKAEVAK